MADPIECLLCNLQNKCVLFIYFRLLNNLTLQINLINIAQRMLFRDYTLLPSDPNYMTMQSTDARSAKYDEPMSESDLLLSESGGERLEI